MIKKCGILFDKLNELIDSVEVCYQNPIYEFIVCDNDYESNTSSDVTTCNQ